MYVFKLECCWSSSFCPALLKSNVLGHIIQDPSYNASTAIFELGVYTRRAPFPNVHLVYFVVVHVRSNFSHTRPLAARQKGLRIRQVKEK